MSSNDIADTSATNPYSDGLVAPGLYLQYPNDPGAAGAYFSLSSAFDLQEFQGYPVENEIPCATVGCEGTITGGVQDIYTINYLASDDTLLGTDTLEFQGQDSAAPEPASMLLLASGLALIALCTYRKRIFRQSC